MSGSTGNRCIIYEKLDALDEARTVADLVRRLKPILGELAYYAVTGEASVMEAREEWHSQYADALYGATASDYNAGLAPASRRQPAGAGAGAAPPVSRRRLTADHGERRQAPPCGRGSPSTRGSLSTRECPSTRGSLSPERRQAPPPPNRPRPGDIPSSLQAIMNGSHPSLKDDDR